MVGTLNTKLLRELWQMRLQLLSIALVVAAGVMVVVTMRGSYESLLTARDNWYSRAVFADIWAPLVRAPLALAQRIEEIDGVAQTDTRIRKLATLDLPGLDMPAQGLFVSVPVFGRPRLNDLRVLQGRYINASEPDEILVSEKFAQARNLKPGDELIAILNGRARDLYIAGIASSPEFSYSVPAGSLMPEYDRFGVIWMSREFLGPAFGLDGAFNELILALEPGANASRVLKQVDVILEPFGGQDSYARKDQLSHLMLENELAEIRILGTVIPAVFLSVAIFLLHQVLNRLISIQRSEIAVLKAFGYHNWQIGWHYLGFALVAVFLGAISGGLGGIWLGAALIGLYGQYFEIPGLAYEPSAVLFLLATGLALGGAISGALFAVRNAIALPPAEAMRPPAPSRFKPGPLERLGLGRILSPASKLILRNLERRPAQYLLSISGVSASLGILVTGMFIFDSMNFLMDTQFRLIQREDIAVSFEQNISDNVLFELERIPGITLVEPYRVAPARLGNGHLDKDVSIMGISASAKLRTIVNPKGEARPFPGGGVVLSELLARHLKVSKGDQLTLKWLEAKRLETTVSVSGISDDYIGLSAYMNLEEMGYLSGSQFQVSGALLLVEDSARANVFRHLKTMPLVAGVSSPQRMLKSYQEEIAKSLTTSSAFLLGFACLIAFGVIYNTARISLSERGRELSSLRVMGFHRSEVAMLLLGEQMIVVMLALPLGCLLGLGMSALVCQAMENDTYRLPLVVAPQTFLLASLIILVAALISMYAVRRRLDRQDLIAVLKTRE